MDVIQELQNGNLLSVLLYLGFSFTICYGIGFAAKKVLMFTLFVVGVFFFGVFLLIYNDILIGFNWQGMNVAYDSFITMLYHTTKELITFALSQLPEATMGGLGLFFGFKRH